MITSVTIHVLVGLMSCSSARPSPKLATTASRAQADGAQAASGEISNSFQDELNVGTASVPFAAAAACLAAFARWRSIATFHDTEADQHHDDAQNGRQCEVEECHALAARIREMFANP